MRVGEHPNEVNFVSANSVTLDASAREGEIATNVPFQASAMVEFQFE